MLRRVFQALFHLPAQRAPEPTRRALNLPLEPTLKNMPALAERIVQVTRNLDNVQLDYSAESLNWVDGRILQFRQERQTFNDIGETVFLFGCYAGEVFSRTLGSSWAEPSEAERTLGFSMPGVRSKDGQFWNPIGKAFRLLENGPEGSIHHLWVVASSATARGGA